MVDLLYASDKYRIRAGAGRVVINGDLLLSKEDAVKLLAGIDSIALDESIDDEEMTKRCDKLISEQTGSVMAMLMGTC